MIDGGWEIFGGITTIYPYGICMAVGIVSCFLFLYLTMEKNNFNDEAIFKILFVGIASALFGIFMASVFQGIYNVIAGKSFSLNSMTFFGGLIGGTCGFLGVWNLYVYVIAPRTKFKLLQNNMNAGLSDALPFIPAGIALAHAFGRLGCTFAGCCHGKETDAWYGIYMYTHTYGYAKVIPTQLFESIFLFMLSGIMILLYFKYKFKYNFSVYTIAYGIWRFGIEYARSDNRGSFVPGLSPSQFWSLVMIAVGIGYFFLYKYVLQLKMKHPELQPAVREPKVKAAATASVAADGEIVSGEDTEKEEISDETVSDNAASDEIVSDSPEEKDEKE